MVEYIIAYTISAVVILLFLGIPMIGIIVCLIKEFKKPYSSGLFDGRPYWSENDVKVQNIDLGPTWNKISLILGLLFIIALVLFCNFLGNYAGGG